MTHTEGRFEWDTKKAESNLAKHGVSFDDAMQVLDLPFLVVTEAATSASGEARKMTLGELNGVLVICIITTDRENRVRIISARPHPKKKGTFMKKETPAERLARHKRLAALPDSSIDFSDIPEMTKAQMDAAIVVRGGYRTGAGRKPSGHVSMRISIRPQTRKRIEALAKKQGMTMSAVVDSMFAKAK